MAKPKLTDRQWALERHRYRAEPGGPFLPSVTSVVDVATDKGGMIYAASEVTARLLLTPPRTFKAWATEERERLLATRGGTEWAIAKRELGRTGSDLDVLVSWARRQHDVQWKMKADRGTRVHEVAALWAAGREAEVEGDLQGYVDALEAFRRDHRMTTLLSEIPVANLEFGYGGRPDEIARTEVAGHPATFLVDYKTGGHYPFDLALQMVGYWHAEQILWDLDGAVMGLKPLPYLDGAIGVYLHDDGTYDLHNPFEHIPLEVAREAFYSALNVLNTRREHEKAIKAAAKAGAGGDTDDDDD